MEAAQVARIRYAVRSQSRSAATRIGICAIPHAVRSGFALIPHRLQIRYAVRSEFSVTK